MGDKKQVEKEKNDKDYRFFDYRLTQLEFKLDKGLTQIEEKQETYNIQVMQTLTTLQDGQNKQMERIAEMRQRQSSLEEKIGCIDELKKTSQANSDGVTHLDHRINVMQKIMFIVGGAAATSFIAALFTLLTR